MTTAQREAHIRLMQKLPVRTHYREEQPELDKYSGKPVSSEALRHGIAKRAPYKVTPWRVNKWLWK